MHTLHILPKDLHICKLTAVNVVDVEERSREAEMQKKRSDGGKVEGGCFFFLHDRPIKSQLPVCSDSSCFITFSVSCLLSAGAETHCSQM